MQDPSWAVVYCANIAIISYFPTNTSAGGNKYSPIPSWQLVNAPRMLIAMRSPLLE